MSVLEMVFVDTVRCLFVLIFVGQCEEFVLILCRFFFFFFFFFFLWPQNSLVRKQGVSF